MEYRQFKANCRKFNSKLPCKEIRDMYTLMYGMNMNPTTTCKANTIAYEAPKAMPVPKPVPCWNSPIKKQEGNPPMTAKINFNTAMNVAAPATNIEATQRDFAVKRISDIKFDHRDALRAQFFLNCNTAPRTAKALVEAIKNDEFSFDEKALARVGEDELRYYNNQFGIIWGKNVPDNDGYKTAMEVLDTVTQAAIDTATLAPVEELLKVLEGYQNWKYTPAV